MAINGFRADGEVYRYNASALEGDVAIPDGSVTLDSLASGVIDDTLAVDGAAADAKATGDAITALNDSYTNLALQIDRILEAASVPTTATSYSCAWSDYDLLIIQSCFYSNVRESIVVTKGYFAVTSSTYRVMLYDHQSGDRIYEVYKNGTSAVYAAITTGSAGTASLNLKIYGVKLAK